MNLNDAAQHWLQLTGILAVEVLATALLFWVAHRWITSAIGKRTCCHMAIASVLLVSLLELSGSGRSAMAWIRKSNTTKISPTQTAAPGKKSSVVEPAQSLPLIGTPRLVEPAIPQNPARMAMMAPVTTVTNVQPSDSRISLPALVAGFFLLWAVVTAVLVVRVAVARLVLVLFRMRHRKVSDPKIWELIQSAASQLGLKRKVRVLESSRLSCPIAFGIFRPTIGLPVGFAEKHNPTKRHAMLAHELAHLAADDPGWCLAADLMAALLWWHPAAWWMRQRLQLLSELAADEAAMLVPNGPRALCECLVELGAQFVRSPSGHMSAGGSQSSLGCRVERLLSMESRAFKPARHRSARAAGILGGLVLTVAVIASTAWAEPRSITKGQTMKSTQIKSSLAALALISSIPGFHALTATTVTAADRTPRGEGAPPAGGAIGIAPGIPGQADPFSAPATRHRGQWPAGAKDRDPERGAKVQAKLRDMTLDEVTFAGLPLSEVLRFISDESRKHDPEKKGINFLINPNQGWTSQPPSPIDPSTGLPMTAQATEAVDVGSIVVNFNLPLRHINLRDLLDAIVKVADRPIEYALEDYGVVFSLRQDVSVAPVAGNMRYSATPGSLAVRTFRVDTNLFAAGMESAFGIKIEKGGGKEGLRSRQVQAAMKELLAQLGISLEGNKTVFYNELTGVLMVRATPEDLEVVQAAIETLGADKDRAQASVGGYPGAANNFPGAALDPNAEMARRYGLVPPSGARR